MLESSTECGRLDNYEVRHEVSFSPYLHNDHAVDTKRKENSR